MVGLPKGGGRQGECVLSYFLYNVTGAGNHLGDDFAAATPGGFADFHHVPVTVIIEDRNDFRTGGEMIIRVCPHDAVGAVAEQTGHGLDTVMVGDQVVGVGFAEPSAPGRLTPRRMRLRHPVVGSSSWVVIGGRVSSLPSLASCPVRIVVLSSSSASGFKSAKSQQPAPWAAAGHRLGTRSGEGVTMSTSVALA